MYRYRFFPICFEASSNNFCTEKAFKGSKGISQIFERLILKQIISFVDKFLLKYHFRKGLSAQDYLLNILQKWKSTFDNNKIFGVRFTNLSKAFYCILNRLIIA